MTSIRLLGGGSEYRAALVLKNAASRACLNPRFSAGTCRTSSPAGRWLLFCAGRSRGTNRPAAVLPRTDLDLDAGGKCSSRQGGMLYSGPAEDVQIGGGGVQGKLIRDSAKKLASADSPCEGRPLIALATGCDVFMAHAAYSGTSEGRRGLSPLQSGLRCTRAIPDGSRVYYNPWIL